MASSVENLTVVTTTEFDLPVIDISQFPLEESVEKLKYHPGVATVREACKEFGFFRVVNTGIPNDLLESVESVCQKLFSMPQEVKFRALTSDPFESYHRKPSSENFCLLNLPDSDSVRALSDKIWPEAGNPKFCETIGQYTFYLADLTRIIAKIILASLGLDVESFYHSDLEKCTNELRIHHYSSDGRISMDEEAIFSHTDMGCMTIIYQANEGGLQIRSEEGEWLNVKPLPHSFVVNICDCFKAWSNGRYRSAVHRVVYSGWMDRISLAWFVQFYPADKMISAPAELVDDDHPRRYKPFIFSDYKQQYFNHLSSYQETRPMMAFIDSYAGLSTAS